MSEAPQAPSLPHHPLTGRWQIPLLAAGLLLFAGGLLRMSAAHRPVTFQEELERVAVLEKAGALGRANAYLLDLLADPRKTPEQRGELHRRLATIIHGAEEPLSLHNRRNVRAIISNSREAARYGAAAGAEDWIRLGDAYGWSQSFGEAKDAYRQALRMSPPRPDRIRRLLLEAQFASGKPLQAEGIEDLDGILDDPSAAPENYLWALDLKVANLLDRGEAAGASELVTAGKARLAGTAEKLALTYTEAVCSCEQGSRYSEEAEGLLRSLLSDWRVRDELWGKANWLLGRLQQLDDRPQAALSFYDEVLEVFAAGDLADACLLGRSEALAALERYEAALEGFARLNDRLSHRRKNPYLEEGAVRLTVTAIGESLLRSGSTDLGIEFFRLALNMTDPADKKSGTYYLSRIAAGLTQLAAASAEGATGRAGGDKSTALRAEAGEMYLSLARLQANDEVAAAALVQSAVEDLDAAGMTARIAEVLAAFVRDYPASDRRAWAMNRLGQAYQALRMYREAAAIYGETIAQYPRQLEATASMVPLAECLLAMKGEDARRGVELLTTIVDDAGPEPLFDPQAQEYRSALFRLAEHYCRATEEEEPQHAEKAVARLETAIALYPDDPQVTRLEFLLADAYRQSGLLVREATSQPSRGSRPGQQESESRLRQAMAGFERVIEALAPQDASALSDLEQTYLRASYLYRADCLFDLGRYEEAVAAYNEAVWRYENQPEAVTASMQIVHCYQRLGRRAESSAALERLSWLLKKMPAKAFEASSGMSSKAYWEGMVARLQRTGVY